MINERDISDFVISIFDESMNLNASKFSRPVKMLTIAVSDREVFCFNNLSEESKLLLLTCIDIEEELNKNLQGNWYLFYVSFHDNLIRDIVKIAPNLPIHKALRWFRDYPAEQGGANYLGFVTASGDRLAIFCYDDCECNLTIELHYKIDHTHES